MKIFLSALLILALPITGVELVSSDKAVQVRETRKVAEGSGANSLDKIETASQAQASVQSPSYFLDIQNAFLPSVFRMTSAIQALVVPQPVPSDVRFWDTVEKSEKKFTDYVHYLLEAASRYFKSNTFTDVTSAMNHIVDATAVFRDEIKDTVQARDISFATLTEELEKLFMAIVEDLKQIPAPDNAPSHAERAKMVDKILDDTTQGLVQLGARHGIKEEVVTTYLNALRPHVQRLIVAVGDINEQHPQLLSLLIFSIAVMLIPELWILRPLLSMFGFGPAGPVKGSIAAWLQRRFWGAAVASGSWFAWLQAAGMGVSFGWTWLITKLPLWIFGILVLMRVPSLIKRG